MTGSFPVLSGVRCKPWRFKQLVKKNSKQTSSCDFSIELCFQYGSQGLNSGAEVFALWGEIYIKVHTFLMT